jgi:hypothetical protein
VNQEDRERRRFPWIPILALIIPIVISIASLSLSFVLWVNTTQNAQDIRIAVIEANFVHTRNTLDRIEKDVSAVRQQLEESSDKRR